MSPRVGSIYDATLRALGWLAFAGILATSLHDASLAYDGWYYHLPFAARLVGLLPASSYIFHAANEARYAGFALLGELLQGILWRLTGRAESANLVAFASVPLLAWFLKARWRVPFALTLLALFAVPLVQTHAPSCYVDLPGNAAACVLVLLVMDAYVKRSPVPTRDVLLALLAGAIAANIKPLLQPVVGLALLALFVHVARQRAWRLVLAMVVASPIVLFTPLKNAILHQNPFFPIGVHLLGHDLPGPEGAYASSPAWLANSPRAWRFVCSLLEVGIRPLADPHRWTVDQWMPDDTDGNRMGGFFNAYVVVLVVALAYRVARDRSRLARIAGVTFGLYTLVIASMPQSHELRYYLSWMLLLVALNLVLACRPGAPKVSLGPRTLGAIAAVAFAVVVASTRGAYVVPGGLTVAELVRSRVDAASLARIHEGERVCVAREPFNLLWADVFHAPRRYVVVEAEAPGECGTLREVGSP